MVITRLGRQWRRVRPRTVLAGIPTPIPRCSPGYESEWCGQAVKKDGGDLPQSEQHLRNSQMRAKRRQGRCAGGQQVREKTFEHVERGMHGMNASADPAQRTGQLNVQTHSPAGRLQARRLLDIAHHRFNLGQGTRQPRGQTVR